MSAVEGEDLCIPLGLIFSIHIEHSKLSSKDAAETCVVEKVSQKWEKTLLNTLSRFIFSCVLWQNKCKFVLTKYMTKPLTYFKVTD